VASWHGSTTMANEQVGSNEWQVECTPSGICGGRWRVSNQRQAGRNVRDGTTIRITPREGTCTVWWGWNVVAGWGVGRWWWACGQVWEWNVAVCGGGGGTWVGCGRWWGSDAGVWQAGGNHQVACSGPRTPHVQPHDNPWQVECGSGGRGRRQKVC